jgi:two-component system sensor histidine kinase LytS
MTLLEQELNHVKAYLSIEETRFVNKLEVVYDIDPNALLQNIPPLTLQPLVENSIKHGFKNKENNCIIKIIIRKDNNVIQIKVEDNGEGMRQERVKQIGQPQLESEKGSGLALYNVNHRLSMMFGDQASLKIKSNPGEGTEISFSIPYHEGAM